MYLPRFLADGSISFVSFSASNSNQLLILDVMPVFVGSVTLSCASEAACSCAAFCASDVSFSRTLLRAFASFPPFRAVLRFLISSFLSFLSRDSRSICNDSAILFRISCAFASLCDALPNELLPISGKDDFIAFRTSLLTSGNSGVVTASAPFLIAGGLTLGVGVSDLGFLPVSAL